MSEALSTAVRRALRAVAVPASAEAMRLYMKSEMPCLGVSSADRRACARALAQRLAWDSAEAFEADVRQVWRGARYREERYTAIALARSPQARAWRGLRTLPLYEEMIVTGAWWDFVDEIAAHLVGELVVRDPSPVQRLMRVWSRDSNLWKRRTAILCQLRRKADVDLALLYDCIEPSLGAREFFLQKAIGWALRQVAWTQPDEVRRYVAQHDAGLAPLSRREALKNLATARAR